MDNEQEHASKPVKEHESRESSADAPTAMQRDDSSGSPPAADTSRVVDRILSQAQARPAASGALASTPRDIERVRDIIVGPQMRDYEQRFQTLQRDMERLRNEIVELGVQLTEQDQEHNRRVQNLRREARQSDDDVRNEARAVAQRLMYDKVDRHALGELFVELGSYIKTGGSFKEFLDDSRVGGETE